MINIGRFGLCIVLLGLATMHCTARSVYQDDEDSSLEADQENTLREWLDEFVNKRNVVDENDDDVARYVRFLNYSIAL